MAKAIASGAIQGTETFEASMTLEIPALGLSVRLAGDVALG